MPKAPVSVIIKKPNHKYGEPRATKNDPNRKHNGVDYEVPEGTSVKASAPGRVVLVDKIEGKERIETNNKRKKVKKFAAAYGNVVIIYHGQDIKTQKHTYTLYSHLVDTRSVRKGKRVEQGQLIGLSGRTGTRQDFYKKEGGYKLHFEVIASRSELRDWDMRVKTDYGRQNQTYRMNPRSFFKEGYFVEMIDGLYTVNLGDGTTLTYDGNQYVHRDSSGKVLHVVKKGERPPHGLDAMTVITSLMDFDAVMTVLHGGKIFPFIMLDPKLFKIPGMTRSDTV